MRQHTSDMVGYIEQFYLQFTPLTNGERILKIGNVSTKLLPSVGGPLLGHSVWMQTLLMHILSSPFVLLYAPFIDPLGL